MLLSFYEESPEIKKLIDELNELQSIYDNVRMTYEFEEPTVEEEDGMLVVEDNTRSTINFTEKDLDNILGITTKIRNRIIE